MTPRERLKHTLAMRWLDDLPEDVLLVRDPKGAQPTSADPASSLGVKVVQLV